MLIDFCTKLKKLLKKFYILFYKLNQYEPLCHYFFQTITFITIYNSTLPVYHNLNISS